MMKQVIFIIFFTFLTAQIATAQYKVVPNRPYSTLNASPGFITINEITYGMGLSGMSFPYSKHFFGMTTVNGYQVNKNFIFAGGTGFYIYESGLLIPLFLDFRYSFYISTLTPYLFADGGLLINPSLLDNTKLFINPGIGARYTLSRKLAVNLGAGIHSQVDGTVRESFLNMKLGAVYKF
jgi:hypothetical protein